MKLSIHTPTILIVADGCKRLLAMLSDSDYGRHSVVAACTATAWELFKAANVISVVFECTKATDLPVGRAMKQWNSPVPMIVVANDWSALEQMEFADVLLSRSVEPEILVRHIKAQI